MKDNRDTLSTSGPFTEALRLSLKNKINQGESIAHIARRIGTNRTTLSCFVHVNKGINYEAGVKLRQYLLGELE